MTSNWGLGGWGQIPWGSASNVLPVNSAETLTLTEAVYATQHAFTVYNVGGYSIVIEFPTAFDYGEVANLSHYNVTPIPESSGVPVRLLSAEVTSTTLASGTAGTLLADFSSSDPVLTRTLQLDGTVTSDNLDDYIVITSGTNTGRYQIVSVLSSTTVQLDRSLFLSDPLNGALPWDLTGGATGVTLTCSKLTGDADYYVTVTGLRDQESHSIDCQGDFRTQNVPRPRLLSVEMYNDEGTILVTYDQEMLQDPTGTLNPSDYNISGASTVGVQRVLSVSPSQVALQTTGLTSGGYVLQVNTSGTPKDVAGNPLDPVFNTAAFFGTSPLTHRSIFTDKGPIAKPSLTVQSGINATLDTFTDVTLPGAALTANHVGLYITLSGGIINGGTFRILAVTAATKATLQASFSLPDPSSGSLTWALIDPRNGQIADDPADVTVLINSVPVTPEAVVGLLGQIVLNAAPGPTDDVKVDYNWICNPVVDIRRLNSREFRLNSWNRDVGYIADISQHKYRYNNTLIRPDTYVPDDMQALLDQPLLRELHYRAYERAYTPVLNDPNLLVLNTPTHRIAYPPMQRQLSESFIRYEALVLPENNITAPWIRKGTGLASVSAGVLTVQDNSTGIFPTGEGIFWVRGVDLSFPHVFALAWRVEVPSVSTFDGVFTGLAAGYSDELLSVIVGFLEEGGIKKIGFLRRGSTDDPSVISSWVGGFNLLGSSTYQPVDFDWSVLHSYRLFRDPNGVVRLYIDGDVTEIARIIPDDLPFLEELNAPLDGIQDVFFGSISRPAESISKWDFVRYLSLPLNPQQTAPSSFTSYEANVVPELDTKPWTPVGFHGTETIISTDFLLLDSTSATDVDPSVVGLVGSDFRGFVRLEPLLTAASEVVLDIGVDLRTHTFGVTPNGLMAAIDNGDRVLQLCFFPDKPSPKKSYGGRSLPEDFSPDAWSSMGTATASMVGRVLKITDTAVGDGRVYFIDDTAPPLSDARVVLAGNDYILESRSKVISYTVDGSGFAGVFSQVFDGTRAVGLMLIELVGVRYVAFTSDGADLGPTARFAFEWNDGAFHTYRFVKNTAGDLVSLFVDGAFVGSLAYSSFNTPAPSLTGQISFGSSTPASAAALSEVEWRYCNVWRVLSDQRHYVGLWKGSDSDSLVGYHLPLKVSGKNALVTGNALGDATVDFLATGVVIGDLLVVDAGSNKGVYEVAGVSSATSLTIVGVWPVGPSEVDYRIVKEQDWTVQHKYRILKNPTGDVNVLIDSDPVPIIATNYNSLDLPLSAAGVVHTLTEGVAGIAFGSFEPTDLSQSSWDFVRYGITRALNELRIVPPHQVLNQWNVMASPEHLRSSIVHSHTSYKSSSTGIPPKIDPDFLTNPGLIAFTLLNDGTPLVPETQSFEVRGPYPTQEYVSALNRPEDVLNSDGDFTLNDGAIRFKLVVPDDVLYTSLDVIEQTTGVEDLLAPFCDCSGLLSLALEYTKEVCLTYDGSVLPELSDAPTPWVLVSDNPAQVTTTAFAGILTYSTGVLGTQTVYRNSTPLPDAPGLQTEATFNLKLLNDSTSGTGDSQVRFGLSAPGMTLGLAFVTSILAERFVLAVDLNSGVTLGAMAFDYLDGNFHQYRIVRDPSAGTVQIFIDS